MPDRFSIQYSRAIDDAHNEPGDVVLAVCIESRHLGGFSTDECAPGFLAGPGNAFDNLETSDLTEIVVTDTIPVRAGCPTNVRVLPCAELLTDSIRRIFVDDSVSEVFGGENQLF